MREALPNYYRILQIDPSAEAEIITLVYKRLLRKYHPDVNKSPEAIERTRDIINAYEILSDPKKRAEYDQQQVEYALQRFDQGLASQVGLDYTPLRELLASGKWAAADRETRWTMLKITERTQQGFFTFEDIEQFPEIDLLTINKLWLQHSSGKFGFSIQMRIYENVGKNINIFAEKVGWKNGNHWLDSDKYLFDVTAPRGHLPGCLFVVRKIRASHVGLQASEVAENSMIAISQRLSEVQNT